MLVGCNKKVEDKTVYLIGKTVNQEGSSETAKQEPEKSDNKNIVIGFVNKLSAEIVMISVIDPVTDEQVEQVTYAHGSKDTPERDVTADLMAAEDVLKRGITGVDVVRALYESGFEDLAGSVLNMLKQRVVGDYMQTAAILDRGFHVLSGVNTPNDYMGPGTGYRVEGERWEEIKKIPHIINPKDI